jgi:hypothetical protein
VSCCVAYGAAWESAKLEPNYTPLLAGGGKNRRAGKLICWRSVFGENGPEWTQLLNMTSTAEVVLRPFATAGEIAASNKPVLNFSRRNGNGVKSVLAP